MCSPQGPQAAKKLLQGQKPLQEGEQAADCWGKRPGLDQKSRVPGLIASLICRMPVSTVHARPVIVPTRSPDVFQVPFALPL